MKYNIIMYKFKDDNNKRKSQQKAQQIVVLELVLTKTFNTFQLSQSLMSQYITLIFHITKINKIYK